MTILLSTMMAILVVAAAMVAFLQHAKRVNQEGEWLANGRAGHGTGNVPRYAEAALATRYVLVKKGTADNEVLVNGATDRPLGSIQDSAAINEPVAVQLLGGGPGTVPMVAAKAIDVDEPVYTAADGKVTDASTTGVFCVGVALTAAAADGDVIDVAPIHTIVAEA